MIPWIKQMLHQGCRALALGWAMLRSRFERADIAFFHELLPPPDGGGNQFIRALARCFEKRGFRVVFNRIPVGTRAVYFNSFNFNATELQWWHRLFGRDLPTVHRIDGPIQVYRGFDDGADAQVWESNRRMATRSIVQSRFSLEMHMELGVALAEPTLVMNAADPAIFHPPPERQPLNGRKVVLIATSWSDNPSKGLAVYQWLDRNLDFESFEFWFAGRIKGEFENIQLLGAMDSQALANKLRKADIYITASRLDPCSNSLIEALSCGLPALYLNSGGHPEIVGKAGLPFEEAEEIPELLDRMLAEFTLYQQAIELPTLEEVADAYLAVAGIQSASK